MSSEPQQSGTGEADDAATEEPDTGATPQPSETSSAPEPADGDDSTEPGLQPSKASIAPAETDETSDAAPETDDASDSHSGNDASDPSAEADDEAEASGESSEPEEGDLVGTVISERYRLDEFIGGGGMGEVYKAEHVMMKKTVAIKILRSEVTDRRKLVERFRREAQAAGNLDHPNICSATDFGRAESGAFYLVMEYVEGRNLGDVLAHHGSLEIDRALQIADQIADALEVAHESGVVHRDLKPENVMLLEQPDGTESVKVLDFGVSRVQMADNMPSITKTGAVFGTPHYMSPEQAGGEEVDTRADLYGLGSVLYEMLTGRPVFDGEKSVHVMAAHLKDEPKPPSEAADWVDIPRELDALVLHLLEKDPDDRPQSATAVRGRLEVIRQRLRGESTELPESEQSFNLSAPTGTWLGRAGNTTRKFYRVVDDKLPFGIDTSRVSGEKLAVVTLVGIAVALLAGVAGIYTAKQLIERKSQDEIRATLLSERRTYQNQPDVEKAMKSFRSGAPGEAAAALLKLEEKDASNAHLQFLLGRTRAAAGSWKDALEHYENAVRKRPNYASDPALLGDVVFALGSANDEYSNAAKKILKLEIARPEVREEVTRVAWHADSRRRRSRAYELLEDADLLGELPVWERHAVELRRASGCKEHREHIEGLADSDSPKALEILRIYDRIPRSGYGAFGNKDPYGCVRDDIEEAIDRLESAGEEGSSESNEEGSG